MSVSYVIVVAILALVGDIQHVLSAPSSIVPLPENALQDLQQAFKPIVDMIMEKSKGFMEQMSHWSEATSPAKKEQDPCTSLFGKCTFGPRSGFISKVFSKPMVQVRVFKIDRQINPHTHATKKVILQKFETRSPLSSNAGGFFEDGFSKKFLSDVKTTTSSSSNGYSSGSSNNFENMIRSMQNEMNHEPEPTFPFSHKDEKFKMPPFFFPHVMKIEHHSEPKPAIVKEDFHFPIMKNTGFDMDHDFEPSMPLITVKSYHPSDMHGNIFTSSIRSM